MLFLCIISVCLLWHRVECSLSSHFYRRPNLRLLEFTGTFCHSLSWVPIVHHLFLSTITIECELHWLLCCLSWRTSCIVHKFGLSLIIFHLRFIHSFKVQRRCLFLFYTENSDISLLFQRSLLFLLLSRCIDIWVWGLDELNDRASIEHRSDCDTKLPHITFRGHLIGFDGRLLRLMLLWRHILINTFHVRNRLVFFSILQNDFAFAIEFKVLRIDLAMTSASGVKVLKSLTRDNEHSSDRIIV